MLHDIRAWLNDLGLAKHADAFEDNGVDGELLGELTNEDLKDLGVNRLGDRKILLAAIQALPDVADEEAVATPLVEQPRAERRQLTVMFVDMVGSTALSSRLDPEELRDIITEFQNVVAGAVTRFDGQIAPSWYSNMGVMIFAKSSNHA